MPDFPPDTVAFITGAASGIGFAVARQLILDGVTNLALIDLSPVPLISTTENLLSLPKKSTILTLSYDVSVEDEVDRAMSETIQKFGRIDICFNAAGVLGKRTGTADAESVSLDNVLDVNLKGLWFCERAELRQFLKQEERDVCTGLPFKTRGSILNVGSIASHLGLPNSAPYAMSKHGVLGLTRTDSTNYASKGIRINCICPGFIHTPMVATFLGNEDEKSAILNRSPVVRLGLPEEVAYTAVFLLSDRASFITGAGIDVDGGWSSH
ncbi:e4e9f6e0-4703-4032-9674-aba4dc2ba673 [Sclerotinia trifoliorum]|uniref:Short-chain dehydrogenase/reductase ABA4 n=1 Tax=Sclerotinia trifoliorum TaxID=28548 RepID=A0A8H2W2A3_9HELO|nr:e4e9f6e0-4703-4032-9674-aba4dc2ba673 [Sclerotinia trifoliorum]